MRVIHVELPPHDDFMDRIMDRIMMADAAMLDYAPDIACWMNYFCPDVTRILETGDKDWLEREYLKWLNGSRTPKEYKFTALGLGIMQVPDILAETARYVAENTVYEEDPMNLSLFYKKPKPETCPLQYIINENEPKTRSGNYEISVYHWHDFITSNEHFMNAVSTVKQVQTRYAKYEDEFPDEIRYRYTARQRSSIGLTNRKVIRRGVDTLTNLIGYDETRKFVSSKQPLLIPGEKVSFRLTLDKLSSNDSHGMKTEVLVDNEPVCNLCIYTPLTPPLDHVINIITHVRAGLEDDILQAGNVMNVVGDKPTGIDLLDEKIGPRNPRIRVGSIIVPGTEHDLPRDWQKEVEFIRLGGSDKVRAIRTQRSHDVLKHLYQDCLPDFRQPKFKFIEWSEHAEGNCG